MFVLSRTFWKRLAQITILAAIGDAFPPSLNGKFQTRIERQFRVL
jgi:hypothetical protein